MTTQWFIIKLIDITHVPASSYHHKRCCLLLREIGNITFEKMKLVDLHYYPGTQ